ncbi:uncharacterized protein LOC144617176 [Panthera onca]
MAAAQTPPLSGRERRRPQLEAISREGRPKTLPARADRRGCTRARAGGHAGAKEAGPGRRTMLTIPGIKNYIEKCKTLKNQRLPLAFALSKGVWPKSLSASGLQEN